MRIEFYKHNLSEEDISLANKVMRSDFLTTGPMVRRFEEKLARFLNIGEAVALTSCTAAIHLSLLRFGIGEGDEVITTPTTFCATVAAIIQSGATPVFVDVNPDSGLIGPESVEAAITRKTRAVIPVHLYGRMADMRSFAALSQKYGLVIIEDAAHAIEAVSDGIRPGQLSSAACLSFYATKSMTSGEGGALVCMSKEDAAWYRSARHHGISKNAAFRYTKQYEHWDMEMMGWKYNMDDIQAALLINQIDRLDNYRKRRQDLEMLYRELLLGIEGLDFIQTSGKNEISGHHLFTILLPKRCSRDEVLHRLQEKGIGCAVNYRAVHTLSYFKNRFGFSPEDFPVANEIGNRTISLPLYPKLGEHEVKMVCIILREIVSDVAGDVGA